MQNPSILYVNAKTTALIGPILHKFHKDEEQHAALLAPSGAQGVTILICLSVCLAQVCLKR